MLYTVIGVGAFLVFAYINNPNGTIKCVTLILTIRGAAWLVQKLAGAINKENGDIINLTGWSLVVPPAALIVKDAVRGAPESLNSVSNFISSIASVGEAINKFLEKIF